MEFISLIDRLDKFLGNTFVIVSDSIVGELYGHRLHDALLQRGIEAKLLTFPAGEKYKNRQSKADLEDQLVAAGVGRDGCLLALGGGVVSDLAGLVAATYCRGIPYVIIPTTLLSMVDASIGGKVAVNIPGGKNLIGAYHWPSQVLVEPSFLKSLPEVELKNGLAEVIKSALIAAPSMVDYLEQHRKAIMSGEQENLSDLIKLCRSIKSDLVAADPYEKGMRRLLNFGHTIGHAVEAASHYTILHGYGVGIGMIFAAELSAAIGGLSKEESRRIKALITSYGVLPAHLPRWEDVDSFLVADKKAAQAQVRFVLLKALGKPYEFEGQYCCPIEKSLLKKVWENVSDTCLGH
ncbi:MAG: 3-dehydroquinate synthase [Chlamydiota bacterium]